MGLREGGAGCGSGATVLVTRAAKSLVRIGLHLFFTPVPGYADIHYRSLNPDTLTGSYEEEFFCVGKSDTGLS